MLRLKGAPLSARIIFNYLVATVIVFVAELLPYPGIILLYLLGAFWIALLINAMLIHLGYAAFTDKIPRRWLLAPIAAYGAWGTFLYVQSITISRQIEALEAENRIDLPIPANVDLVFENNDLFATTAKRFVVGRRVFMGEFEIQLVRPQLNQGEPCIGGYRSDDDRGLSCAVSRPSPGPHEGLYFRRTTHLPDDNFIERRTAYSLEIEDGHNSRHVGHFGFGGITVISNWPVYLIGCFPNNHNQRWECQGAPLTDLVQYGGRTRSAGVGFDWDAERGQALAELLKGAFR